MDKIRKKRYIIIITIIMLTLFFFTKKSRQLHTPVSPLNSYITSGFGMRTRKGVTRLHRGIDFGSFGRKVPVYAVESGTITAAGWSSSKGTGNRIWLRGKYTGTHYFYAHLSEISVKEGEKVEKGQPMGYTGDTGADDGAIHLHFEMRRTRDKDTAFAPPDSLLSLFKTRK